MSADRYMRLAIDTADAGIAAGQTPFGAVIVCGDVVVAATHNTVWRDGDPTAHAEMNAIRMTSRLLQRIGFPGCVMYTTCEPCPMCLSAIHWAKLDAVYYGATIADARAAGFSELSFPAGQLAAAGGSPLIVERGPLREECAALFDRWKAAGLSRPY